MTNPLRQELQMADRVRVRLRYVTPTPTTEAALVLAKQLGVQGPFNEEVWILVPTGSAFSILEAYLEDFIQLKDAGIVPQEAELVDFKVEAGPDPTTLAYVLD